MSLKTWLAGAIALIALAGCATTGTSSPDRFSLEPSAVSHLRGPQTIKVVNGYLGPAIHTLRFSQNSVTVAMDQKDFTETAINVLSRALEKQGIRASSDSPKTVTLRVRILDHSMGGIMIAPEFTGQVELVAELGNGVSVSRHGRDMYRGLGTEPWGRAFDAAVLVALRGLVSDDKFVAYVNN